MVRSELAKVGAAIGSGGQADVFECHITGIDHSSSLLFKRYRSGVTPLLDPLLELVRWPSQLPKDEAQLVWSNTAWPVAAVVDTSEPTNVIGVLIPRAPDRFSFDADAAKNESQVGRLRELQYLILTERSERLVHVPDLAAATGVVEHLAKVLAIFERHSVVHGDISMRNVLWGFGAAGPESFLLDCDSARIGPTETGFSTVTTPGWSDPRLTTGDIAVPNVDSDRYALAAAVYRIYFRSPGNDLSAVLFDQPAHAGPLPNTMVRYLQTAFSPDNRGPRPTAAQWSTELRHLRAGDVAAGLGLKASPPARRSALAASSPGSAPRSTPICPPAGQSDGSRRSFAFAGVGAVVLLLCGLVAFLVARPSAPEPFVTSDVELAPEQQAVSPVTTTPTLPPEGSESDAVEISDASTATSEPEAVSPLPVPDPTVAGSIVDDFGWTGPHIAFGRDNADGSGCTPEPPGDRLEDGIWFVSPVDATSTVVVVDLACRFSSNREAGTEDATPSNPTVRNEEDRYFSIDVATTTTMWESATQSTSALSPSSLNSHIACAEDTYMWIRIYASELVEGLELERCNSTAITSSAGGGDLGLATQISAPACDGSWVVFVGSVIEPDSYATDIAALLGSYAGSGYLRTDQTCSSLRQSLNGNAIYSAYLGPYDNKTDACHERGRIGGRAYVKRLDQTTPAEQLFTCP